MSKIKKLTTGEVAFFKNYGGASNDDRPTLSDHEKLIDALTWLYKMAQCARNYLTYPHIDNDNWDTWTMRAEWALEANGVDLAEIWEEIDDLKEKNVNFIREK